MLKTPSNTTQMKGNEVKTQKTNIYSFFKSTEKYNYVEKIESTNPTPLSVAGLTTPTIKVAPAGRNHMTDSHTTTISPSTSTTPLIQSAPVVSADQTHGSTALDSSTFKQDAPTESEGSSLALTLISTIKMSQSFDDVVDAPNSTEIGTLTSKLDPAECKENTVLQHTNFSIDSAESPQGDSDKIAAIQHTIDAKITHETQAELITTPTETATKIIASTLVSGIKKRTKKTSEAPKPRAIIESKSASKSTAPSSSNPTDDSPIASATGMSAQVVTYISDNTGAAELDVAAAAVNTDADAKPIKKRRTRKSAVLATINSLAESIDSTTGTQETVAVDGADTAAAAAAASDDTAAEVVNPALGKRVRKKVVLFMPSADESAVDAAIREDTIGATPCNVIINTVADSVDKDKDATAAPKKKTKKEFPATQPASPPVDPLSLLSPGALAKVNSCKDKMSELAKELIESERMIDLCDEALDLDISIDDVIRFVKDCDSTALVDSSVKHTTGDLNDSIVPPQSNDVEGRAEVDIESQFSVTTHDCAIDGVTTALSTLTSTYSSSERITLLINTIIARSVQGSHLPLGQLVDAVRTHLDRVKQRIQPFLSLGTTVSESVVTRAKEILTELQQYAEMPVISDKIKCLADRESYRTKAKNAAGYDDCEEIAVWRWDVKITSYFTKGSQNTLREAKYNRGRYRRALKALSRVIEQVMKSLDEPKLAPLEEAVSVARIDINKAKERRREVERKRAEEAEQKRLKDEAKEAKRREKEEQALQKSPQKEKKVNEKVLSEKEMKDREALEKQKNILNSFFKKSVPGIQRISSQPMTSRAVPAFVLSLDEDGMVVDEEMVQMSQDVSEPSLSQQLTQTAGSVVTTIPLTNAVRITGKYPWQTGRPLDHVAFERDFKSNMSIERISAANRQKNATIQTRRTRRKPVTISVTVASKQGTFGGEEYSEIRNVEVYPTIKTLSFEAFNTEIRPPYVGTFSKRSLLISGRRPFEKDEEALSYEYDSGEEWDDEDEGEDIAMSDGEDENDPDELEYDDVFVRDNDFGSDVGSDGEVMAKVAMRAAGDERLGPRFALSNRIAIEDRDEICFIFDVNSKRSTVYSAEARGHVEGQCDNELQQLCNYTTVIYAHSESLMPKLGAAPTAESKASKSASTGVKLPCVLENGLPGPETEKTKLQNNSSAKASMEATTTDALARFIHGKKEGIDKLVDSFHLDHSNLTKAMIRRTILQLAERKKHELMFGTARWLCKSSIQQAAESSGNAFPEVEFTPKKQSKAPTKPKTKPSLHANATV